MVKENKKRSTNTRVKKKEHSIAYFDYSLFGNIDLPDLLWTGHAI